MVLVNLLEEIASRAFRVIITITKKRRRRRRIILQLRWWRESSERPRPFQQIAFKPILIWCKLCPNGYHQVPITQKLKYIIREQKKDSFVISGILQSMIAETGDPDKCIYTDEREGRVHGTFLDMNSIRSYLIEALDDEKYYIFSKCKKKFTKMNMLLTLIKNLNHGMNVQTDGKFCYIEKVWIKSWFFGKKYLEEMKLHIIVQKLTPHQFCRRPMLDPRKEHVKTCPQGYICKRIS